jgi:hypothetical protein
MAQHGPLDALVLSVVRVQLDEAEAMRAEDDGRRPSMKVARDNLTPAQEAERQRLLHEARVGASTVGERLRQRAAKRAFGRLLDRSSLSEGSLWVQCPEHGRQARDPFSERCVFCG